VGSENGPLVRVIVASHPAPTKKKKKRQVGIIRDGVVYELFWTNLPQSAFTASDVVSLYLHRGAFETALEDEDIEQEPARWCSYSARGELAWQIVAQWTWNLRLELGHLLAPEPVRTTEFAPALPEHHAATSTPPACAPPSGYAPPATATSWKAGRFTGADFPLHPDGSLRCPAGNALVPHERRRESDGSLRVVYAASIRACRPCPLRDQCQWSGSETAKPRQVSILLHPSSVGSAALLWRDWHRRHQRHQRQACLRLHRQVLAMQMEPALPRTAASSPPTISRAQRAHARLSWEERLARNARETQAERIALTLFGLPDRLATFLGLASASRLGMAGVLVLLPPAMCSLQKGHTRGDDLESLLDGLLCGVVDLNRLKKRANGPSCGARGRKQCERLWFRQSPHLEGIVALQNQELIECWPDTGAEPPHLPRQMPFPVLQQAAQKLGRQRDQLLECLAR